MNVYRTATKDEDATFRARNNTFSKANPIIESIAYVNLLDETQYMKYVDYITSLDIQDEIESQLKILDFLSEQLRYRLRIKSDDAIDVREHVKVLRPIFDSIQKENEDTTGDF